MPESDVLLRREDLLAIENTLYEPKKEELVARSLVQVNNRYPAYANEIGYDWYDRTGSAKIIAAGGSANDLPIVGEKGGRVTLSVYTIATGIQFTKAERLAAQAKNSLGKGPALQLDTMRVSTARRYVAETENRLFFVGDKKFGIKGLLTMPGIKKEGVTAFSTPAEILDALLTGKATVEKDNLFKARAVVFDPATVKKLLKPYSETNPMTIRKWLESEGMYFDEIHVTNAMSSTHNTLGSNAFCIFDNDPEVIELGVVQDLELEQPVYDAIGTSVQGVTERCAGAIIRHPSAIYVGTGV